MLTRPHELMCGMTVHDTPLMRLDGNQIDVFSQAELRLLQPHNHKHLVLPINLMKKFQEAETLVFITN